LSIARRLFALVGALCLCGATSARAQIANGVVSRGSFSSPEGTRTLATYRPARLAGPTARALVVVLHGCAQTADDIARGTRMNAAADSGGFVVLYPEQSAAANAQRCWNWFLPEQTARGRGEASILAGMIDSVGRADGIPAGRVSIVGMSAGAAMAANLVAAYPERFAALAMHSGIPAQGATSVMAALTVMRSGVPESDSLGAAVLAAMGDRARALPVIALHGADDKIVSPLNLRAVVRQWTYVNARAAGVPAPVEEHLLPAVGHAWSGGSPDGTFTAPGGPDATAMVIAFLRRVRSIP
jgi:poly(hydroxyalkanoate) depolymerase family esterase